jgi:hypothetical protein
MLTLFAPSKNAGPQPVKTSVDAVFDLPMVMLDSVSSRLRRKSRLS